MADDDTYDHPFGRRRAGRPTNGNSNGSSPEGMGTRPVPIDDIRAEPLDLVAVQADDELINALAGGLAVSSPGLRGYDADDHVAAMLAAWKADVDADPIPRIDLDAAVGAVLAGRRPSGRMRHLVPVASAAALIVVAITGVSIAAHDTRPGDALFSVSKVLYAEEAASYEALATVEQSREKVKQALAVGDKEAAAVAVAEGEAAADQVLAEHGLGEVLERLRKLEVAVDESTPGVPSRVDDDEDEAPPQTSQGEEGGQGTTPPPTTEPGQGEEGGPADGPGTDDDPSGEPGGQDPRSEGPGPGTDDQGPGPGNEDQGPGTDDPGPDTDGPGGGEPGPGDPGPKPEPSEEPPPAGGTDPDPSAEKPAEEPEGDNTSAGPSRAPKPTTVPSDNKAGPPGISGMSASATGTATPSGQPSAG